MSSRLAAALYQRNSTQLELASLNTF